MSQFFKFMFASCLGLVLAFLVIGGILAAIISRATKQAQEPVSVSPNSVLYLDFSKVIPEQTNNLELDPFDFKQEKTLGLHAIKATLERAAEDDDIKGIFLETNVLSTVGMSSGSVLRQALMDFKESGKFIVAYADYYSQSAYYLSTTADELWVNPLGVVDFRGFAAQIPFFKDMLDKVGVDMQVFYAGKFKGATEPYRFNEMSEANRAQIRIYLDDMYRDFLSDIAISRNLEMNTLRQLADEYVGLDSEAAAEAGLVDKVAYRDEVLAELRERLGLEEDEEIPSVTLEDYAKSNPDKKDYSIKDKIAVIYAEGTIEDGEGGPGSVGGETYARYVRKAREDDKVKAIVLRVNSPGGSALASENIWRELSLAREEGKPVVVSMGDYAASGGYYISAMADTIFTQESTLTGSIGVFSIIPDASNLLEDKMGIHFDTVKTGAFSTGLTPFYPLSPSEQLMMQNRTEAMYETFLKRVSDGRGLSRDSVHAIAQGRVWTGGRAVDIGLADRVGGLQDALASAATLADLEEYRTTDYPRVKDPLQQFLDQWTDSEGVQSSYLLRYTGLKKYRQHIQLLDDLRHMEGVQARLPLVVPFE